MGFLFDFACGFVGSVPLAMYAYGYCKQFPVQRCEFNYIPMNVVLIKKLV